jgi:hypothetical protein
MLVREWSSRRRVSLIVVAVVVACSKPVASPSPTAAPTPVPAAVVPAAASTPVATASIEAMGQLPMRLADADYWKLEQEISEPGGYFRIEDNYTSNEGEIGELYTMLRTSHVGGGVYLGVGPEQNFTYIAAIRPRMAFIVDIRRQAVMQHLMYKAMFEMAKDRADFISLLFAKPRPAGLDSASSIDAIWKAFSSVATDSIAANRNYRAVLDRLTKTHGFVFTADETDKLKAVFDAFFYFGPAITTRGSMSGRGGNFTFVDLTGYDFDAAGQPRSFLSTEDNYRFVKYLQEKNLIVPVSGDFAGPQAIKAIGAYLKDHGAVVSAFYVSNVEQYLFGDGHDAAFYSNVSFLPVDSSSVFIRPYSMRRYGYGGYAGNSGSTESLCPIAPFVRAAQAGRITDNSAALACLR